MKTKRIKIKKNEVVGIYFVKRAPTIRYYAAFDSEGRGLEQRIAHPGVRANLTLVGPMTICMIVKNKRKSGRAR